MTKFVTKIVQKSPNLVALIFYHNTDEPLEVHVLLLQFKIGPAELHHFSFPSLENLGQLRNLPQQPIRLGRVTDLRVARHRGDLRAGPEMTWNDIQDEVGLWQTCDQN